MSYPGYRKGNRIKRLTNRLMVYTSTSKVFLASLEDEDKIRAHTWQMASRKDRPNNIYVKCTVWDSPTERRSVLLHRFIMDAQHGQIVDHINGNTLDNRRENLRFVTRQQNSYNNAAKKGGISVRVQKSGKVVYRARIRKDTKLYEIGQFDSREEAEKARERAKLEFFGEFARKAK